MEYNKEKIEAAKILFAEVLELNQQLPENRFIDVDLSGGPQHPAIVVSFWKERETGGFFYDDGDSYFKIYFADKNRSGFPEDCFAKLTAKMQKWKELYCN